MRRRSSRKNFWHRVESFRTVITSSIGFGRKLSKTGGSGFVVYSSADPGIVDDKWDLIAWMAYPVSAKSITAGELEAAAGALAFVKLC